MATHCFIPVRGKRIRVTRLDNCGRPLSSGTEGAVIVTDGFITVTLSSEVEDGVEIVQRNAAGALCVNEQSAASFKRFNVEMEFCGVNPSLLAMMTNAKEYEDYAGDVAGFKVAEGEITGKFALELWTGLSGQACASGADEASGYVVLPFVQSGVLGDIEISGENAATFSMTSAYTKGGNSWGRGPYAVVNNESGTASVLPEALDSLDHLLMVDTGLAIPPAACDPIAMPTAPVIARFAGLGVADTAEDDAPAPAGSDAKVASADKGGDAPVFTSAGVTSAEPGDLVMGGEETTTAKTETKGTTSTKK